MKNGLAVKGLKDALVVSIFYKYGGSQVKYIFTVAL